MRIVRISDVDHVTGSAATPVPGWTGGPVSRTFQAIVPPGMSRNFKCSVVNFSRGATTGFHSHSEDQILIIIAGSGIVATETEERVDDGSGRRGADRESEIAGRARDRRSPSRGVQPARRT